MPARLIGALAVVLLGLVLLLSVRPGTRGGSEPGGAPSGALRVAELPSGAATAADGAAPAPEAIPESRSSEESSAASRASVGEPGVAWIRVAVDPVAGDAPGVGPPVGAQLRWWEARRGRWARTPLDADGRAEVELEGRTRIRVGGLEVDGALALQPRRGVVELAPGETVEVRFTPGGTRLHVVDGDSGEPLDAFDVHVLEWTEVVTARDAESLLAKCDASNHWAEGREGVAIGTLERSTDRLLVRAEGYAHQTVEAGAVEGNSSTVHLYAFGRVLLTSVDPDRWSGLVVSSGADSVALAPANFGEGRVELAAARLEDVLRFDFDGLGTDLPAAGWLTSRLVASGTAIRPAVIDLDELFGQASQKTTVAGRIASVPEGFALDQYAVGLRAVGPATARRYLLEQVEGRRVRIRGTEDPTVFEWGPVAVPAGTWHAEVAFFGLGSEFELASGERRTLRWTLQGGIAELGVCAVGADGAAIEERRVEVWSDAAGLLDAELARRDAVPTAYGALWDAPCDSQQPVPAGLVRLRVSADGFAPFDDFVELEPGQQRLDVVLEPAAQLRVDGEAHWSREGRWPEESFVLVRHVDEDGSETPWSEHWGPMRWEDRRPVFETALDRWAGQRVEVLGPYGWPAAFELPWELDVPDGGAVRVRPFDEAQ